MQHRMASGVLLIAMGCGGGAGDTPTPPSTGSGTGTPITTTGVVQPTTPTTTVHTGDTAPDTGSDAFWNSLADDGHVTLFYEAPNAWTPVERTRLWAMFVEDDGAVEDLAVCAMGGPWPCWTGWPASLDDWVTPITTSPVLVTRDNGADLRLGDLIAAQDLELGGYFGRPETPWAASTDLALELLPGDWGPYAGADEVRTPELISALTPDPLVRWVPELGGAVPVTWTPALEGEVYLLAQVGPATTPITHRLFWLDDDGSFDLDLATLGVTDRTEVRLWLWREHRRLRVVNGHRLVGTAMSVQQWDGVAVDMTGITREDPAADCTAAQGQALLGVGTIWGRLGSGMGALDPGFHTCTGRSASGVEGIYRVEIPPGERLIADLELVGADGSLYLLDDCSAAGTCSRGADTIGVGATDHLEWVNSTAGVVERYLVVDTYLGDAGALPGDAFILTTQLQPETLTVLPETCALAVGGQAVSDGTYVTGLDAHQDDLALTDNECTGVSTPGRDSFMAVEVPPGELLTVTTSDPAVELALFDQCGGACLTGSIGYPDQVQWYNPDALPATLVLAIDVADGAFPQPVFEVAVDTSPASADLLPEDCLTAQATAPSGAGVWTVPLSSMANDLDPGFAVCAGSTTHGPDGVLPLLVPADHYLWATSDDPGVVLWLAEDCTDTNSCHNPGSTAYPGWVEGVSGPTDELWYLVVDHDGLSIPEVFSTVDVLMVPAPTADRATQCIDVPTLAPVGTGVWYGSLAPGQSALDPGSDGCTGAAGSSRESVMRVEVAPGETLRATLPDALGQQLYLLADCTDANTCVAGATADGGPGEVVWTNTSGGVESWSLVVDGGGDLPTPVYRVDIGFETLPAVGAVDDCAAMLASTPVTTGQFAGVDLSGFADDLDPGAAGCTGADLAGPDAMLPIQLQAGELMWAQAIGVDALYTVTDCLDPATCEDASSLWTHRPTVVSRNDTGATLDLGLIADTATVGGGWSIEVAIGPEVTFAPADDCATAAALPSIQTGRSLGFGDLAGFTNQIDPGAVGCTGAPALGGEGIVPVALNPGETVRARVNQLGGDGALYVLSDCANTATCLVGDDQFGATGDWPEEVQWTNDTGIATTVWLVLDGYGQTGEFFADIEVY